MNITAGVKMTARMMGIAAMLAVVPFGVINAAAGNTAKEPKVILLGVDALSWKIVDPMIKKGELPNLEML